MGLRRRAPPHERLSWHRRQQERAWFDFVFFGWVWKDRRELLDPEDRAAFWAMIRFKAIAILLGLVLLALTVLAREWAPV